jgi:ACT domain-containing protein
VSDSHAVLTVLGADRIGIVAGITAVLAEQGVNIEDIRMASMRDLFTMIALVDLAQSAGSFSDLQAALEAAGRELGVQVLIQREAIFHSMHRV